MSDPNNSSTPPCTCIWCSNKLHSTSCTCSWCSTARTYNTAPISTYNVKYITSITTNSITFTNNPNPIIHNEFRNQGGFDLAPGSVFAYRWWALDFRGHSSFLMGVRDKWYPEENIAKCLFSPRFIVQEQQQHPAPYVGCSCGFWAYWKPTYVPKALWTPSYSTPSYSTPLTWNINEKRELYFVAGIVEGYGRSLIGDKGIRCEKARILALHVPYVLLGNDLITLSGDPEWVEKLSRVEYHLETTYGIPVYATEELMLSKHPLTTDYLPSEDER